MTELVESGKIDKLNALDESNRRMAIRRACRKDAEKYIKLQRGQLQRLLTLADYDNPYLTMNPCYEQRVIETFADLLDQDLVFRQLKPVHWSIANETALAEAELEYEDRTDPSVYVDFEAIDGQAVASAFGVELDQTPSFMIWTTTPWTLPANLAIAVHERLNYALVRLDGALTIVADDLVDAVSKVGSIESVERLATCQGSGLVGLTYRHPFCERTSPVVSADYVTLEDGTGLVHTAPVMGSRITAQDCEKVLISTAPSRVTAPMTTPCRSGCEVSLSGKPIQRSLSISGHQVICMLLKTSITPIHMTDDPRHR